MMQCKQMKLNFKEVMVIFTIRQPFDIIYSLYTIRWGRFDGFLSPRMINST